MSAKARGAMATGLMRIPGQVRPHISKRALKKEDLDRTMQSNAVKMGPPRGPPMVSGLKGCDIAVSRRSTMGVKGCADRPLREDDAGLFEGDLSYADARRQGDGWSQCRHVEVSPEFRVEFTANGEE